MPFHPDAEVFPQELFVLIVEAARQDQYTLLQLGLVSKSFLAICQRCLYQRVSLGGLRVVSVMGTKRWCIFDTDKDSLFFKTLTSTPHLAHYVRDFSFRPDAGHTNEHVWDNFHRVLHLMVNLKYLQLTLMTTDRTFYQLLQGLCDHPFQLEVFSWKDYRRKMTDQDIAAFLAFIASQPHLRAVDILSSSASLILPSASCPNLTTFVGDYGVASSVLQDHLITNFVWTGRQLEHSSLLGSDWVHGFSNLRVLVFFDYIPLGTNWAVLARNSQSLEALQVSFESRTAPSDCTVVKVIELLAYLPEMKTLRLFVWNGTHPDLWQMSTVKSLLSASGAAVNKLFNSPMFERMYLGRPGGNLERYIRWVDAKETRSQEVSVDDLVQFYHCLGFDSYLMDRRYIYGE